MTAARSPNRPRSRAARQSPARLPCVLAVLISACDARRNTVCCARPRVSWSCRPRSSSRRDPPQRARAQAGEVDIPRPRPLRMASAARPRLSASSSPLFVRNTAIFFTHGGRCAHGLAAPAGRPDFDVEAQAAGATAERRSCRALCAAGITSANTSTVQRVTSTSPASSAVLQHLLAVAAVILMSAVGRMVQTCARAVRVGLRRLVGRHRW